MAQSKGARQLYNKAYYKAHKEEKASYGRAYRETHREQIAAYARAYDERNREKSGPKNVFKANGIVKSMAWNSKPSRNFIALFIANLTMRYCGRLGIAGRQRKGA